jgi:hypothetical protein
VLPLLICRKDCDKEKRVKLMSDLQKLIQGKIKTVSRVFVFSQAKNTVFDCNPLSHEVTKFQIVQHYIFELDILIV